MAFKLLCSLTEAGQGPLTSEMIRYSGIEPVYQHLHQNGFLHTVDAVPGAITCRWCGAHDLLNVFYKPSTWSGYCADCGWVDIDTLCTLGVDTSHLLRSLANAIGTARNFRPEQLLEHQLWKIGEIEHRRKRRTVFFAMNIQAPDDRITHHLARHCAPGTGIVITTSDALLDNHTLSHTVIPLRAIAHLRKSGLVIENLTEYIEGPSMVREDPVETSLAYFRSGHYALIEGKKIEATLQAYQFVCILLDAKGRPVHKSTIIEMIEMDADEFKPATTFKRCKPILEVFIERDGRGCYWIRKDYLVP